MVSGGAALGTGRAAGNPVARPDDYWDVTVNSGRPRPPVPRPWRLPADPVALDVGLRTVTGAGAPGLSPDVAAGERVVADDLPNAVAVVGN